MGEQARQETATDQSGRWLIRDRDSGRDTAERAALTDLLEGIRDRVLDAAELRPGHCVLDLGAGTGLLTHGAAQRVMPGGYVIAVDRSADALAKMGNTNHPTRTVTADASHLPIPSVSIDRVVARSVLIYLHDLPAALREIARVLKPGGKLSAFEPVNARRHHDAALTGLTEEELNAIEDLRHRSGPGSAAMMAFDVDPLAEAAASAGFTITIDGSIVTDDITTHEQVDGHLHRRPHPGASTPIELIEQQLGGDIAVRYTTAWHNALDQAGRITFTTPVLYFTATRGPQ